VSNPPRSEDFALHDRISPSPNSFEYLSVALRPNRATSARPRVPRTAGDVIAGGFERGQEPGMLPYMLVY
jgi:hypothetical protein